MPESFKAVLHPQSPRYDDWLRVLRQDEVPLKSPRSFFANLGEEADVEVYSLNVEGLTTEQRSRLVNWVSEKFGVAPAMVNEQLEGIGFPVRAVDVTIAMEMRAFL